MLICTFKLIEISNIRLGDYLRDGEVLIRTREQVKIESVGKVLFTLRKIDISLIKSLLFANGVNMALEKPDFKPDSREPASDHRGVMRTHKYDRK